MTEYLFHYTKESNIDYILNKQTLLLNNIDQTNDPYEYKKYDTYEMDNKYEDENDRIFDTDHFIDYKNRPYFDNSEDANNYRIKLKLDTIDSDRRKYYFNYYKNLKNRIIKMISFCTGDYTKNIDDNNRAGFLYPRMWSQYGNNSKGICIVFKKNALIKELSMQLCKDFEIFYNDIEYIDIFSDKHTKEMYDLMRKRDRHVFSNKNKNKRQLLIDDIKNNIQKYFFVKDIDWEGEKEFRILIINKLNNNDINPKIVEINMSKVLFCVVLGENFEYRNEEEPQIDIKKMFSKIESICKKRNIGLKMIKRDIYNCKYKLEHIYSP